MPANQRKLQKKKKKKEDKAKTRRQPGSNCDGSILASGETINSNITSS